MAAEVHHFAYGWVNPTLAYILSFLGSLLGLILTARSRDASGASRLRWLSLAAVAIGGTGIWLMHFMAMLGFDVPNAVLRYDVLWTVVSLLIAVGIVALGLYTVGLGAPAWWKTLLGGTFTGIGIAAMHYAGMAALHLAGRISYDPVLVVLSVVIAIVAASVALWFTVAVRGGRATVGAAAIMGLAICSMHYVGMSAVRVELIHVDRPVPGVSPFALLTPISVIACVVISALAYATVGFSVRQENAAEEALLARTRSIYAASLAGGADGGTGGLVPTGSGTGGPVPTGGGAAPARQGVADAVTTARPGGAKGMPGSGIAAAVGRRGAGRPAATSPDWVGTPTAAWPSAQEPQRTGVPSRWPATHAAGRGGANPGRSESVGS